MRLRFANNFKALAVICMLFVLSNRAAAQLIITQDLPAEGLSLHPYSYIANVGNDDYSIGQVVNKQLAYEKLPRANADLGFTQDHYWVRFELTNNTDRPVEYFLETARPITDLVELYQLTPNQNTLKSVSGDGRRFSDKSFRHRKCIFKISLEPNQSSRFFIHLTSDGEVISLPLILRDATGMIDVSSLEHFIFGIFYGILAIAAILYFFFYFAIKAKTFLYYSLYVLFIGLMHLSLDGYFYQYITPQGGWFSLRAVLIFASLSTFFLGRYSELFLDIKRNDPGLCKFYTAVYIMSAIQLLMLLIPAALPYCYPFVNVIGLCVLLLIVTSLLRMDFLRVPVDKYFKFGIAFLIIGFVIFILNNFGQVPTNFVSQNSSKLGTGLEVIFLSLSMANLIGILKNEREEFNRLALERSEEMNEMKSYFLSNISHELRTPLNAIMNLSGDIAKSTTDDEIRNNAQVIKYSSNSLLSSVNDILDFSKIEKGELKLENAHFNLSDTIDQIKNTSAIKARDAGLDFQFNQSGEIPKLIDGDQMRLCQVLNNIISNAIKFTPAGFVRFECVAQQKNNKVDLTLTISDSGIGITKDKLRNVFGSFTQTNINNKRKYGGLGLGLYIAKTLIDLKNGVINIQSTPDKGTVCTIQLDYNIIDVPVVPSVETPQYDLYGKRILVVEDNAINQMVIKMITKKWQNTEVVYTANGREGVDALLAQQFDIVLMDLQMPVMDGYEATIAIRNGEAGSHNSAIPIIAVTADVMETTKQTVKDIGMNDYLSKPLNNDTLFTAVSQLVNHIALAIP